MKRTVKEIRALIESMKDEDAFPEQETTLTAEQVAPFLETSEGMRLIQPFADRAVTKGLETYKAGTFEKEVNARVNAEILKRNPAETEQEKQIRELNHKFEQSEKSRASDHLVRQLHEEGSKLGIDMFFMEHVMPESLEKGQAFLNAFKERDKQRDAKVMSQRILANTILPGSGIGADVPFEKMPSGPAKMARAEADAMKRLMSSD